MTNEQTHYDPACLPDFLPIYYKRLFPYGLYYQWLNYGGVPKTYFTNREFSFTLKDDVYVRYQSFADQQDMEKEIQKRCPYKIDIGAVFTHRPKDHKTVKAAAFQAQEKELVFDIDMTDYDEVRSCCSGADICPKCWPLMIIAVKIIDTALREDFGFEHLLWVYSGRRGIHCWVCDEQARKLSQNARTAIAEYLSVVKGGENQTKKCTLYDDSIHPSVRRAIDIVEDHFDDYAIRKQDFAGSEEKWGKVLALVPDDAVRSQVLEDCKEVKAESSRARWAILKKRQQDFKDKCKKSWCVTEEIMLQYCYPRLDVNVSKGINHLLKSPFCVHPKTGRVCVSMDPKKIDSFNPFKVPTLSQLCDELNQLENKSEDDPKKRVKDYKRTSLKEYAEIFDKFVHKLAGSWKGKLIEQSDIKKEF
ncbi:LOW QUALITY PROTEIN: DNA primase small subunit-like [Lingula anatina]|uniref:DNA primase n=1 Tax=Lingula anatina TaxID=7574 RepID=A0A1S3HJ03_LINAN|nr:LOW QUALITY PROTEIN: DNA primase small subunit-like [Lingula anatina]|eukprot:XP_013386093.1 LOW QUALITY PROTEIN: DNA primase small subunit-like [Lingula anatina]